MTHPTILVAGGAGYIGSHMVRMLRDEGYPVVVVDNLSTGHADAVGDASLRVGDIGDRAFMAQVLREFRPQCVMHFAAASIVAESVASPARYWRNNVVDTLSLIDAMLDAGVGQFIFSSTAAVYGEPEHVPILESHITRPINAYGRTKLAIESALQDFDRAHGLRSIVFRYFNAAGAHPDGSLGERHDPETHLVPLLLQVASGRRPAIGRFGNDFATRDGSCVRDYVHVQDLCSAHLLGLQRLAAGGDSSVFNLGSGKGSSVTEVIEAVRRVTGRPIPVRDEPRRPGDPAVLLADPTRAHVELGWAPAYRHIDTIVRHAWQWELSLARSKPQPQPA